MSLVTSHEINIVQESLKVDNLPVVLPVVLPVALSNELPVDSPVLIEELPNQVKKESSHIKYSAGIETSCGEAFRCMFKCIAGRSLIKSENLRKSAENTIVKEIEQKQQTKAQTSKYSFIKYF